MDIIMIAYVTAPHGVPEENNAIPHLLCMYETEKPSNPTHSLIFCKSRL